jgi:riboflavin kinase/FMN adenylyltransferase
MNSVATRLHRWRPGGALALGATAVTLGNFDGVHRAHRHMLERVARVAAERDLGSCVVTFEPTPREFFAPARAPARLMTLTEKHLAFAELGIDHHVSVCFDQRVAGMSAERFSQQLLSKALGARHVVAGYDFRYGRNREGDVERLRADGAGLEFEVEQIAARREGDLIISSTAVRDALARGDLDAAARLLGARYSMSGRVVGGQQLGRTLGYPTANLRPGRRILPLEGVFAVSVCDGGSLRHHPAVASLGTRPTVNGRGHLLEVHLFDFQGNLYGRRLRVSFVKKLRDEAKFSSLEAMTEQMHRDAREARAALGATQVNRVSDS